MMINWLCDCSLINEYEKLELLLEQDQFELVSAEAASGHTQSGNLRLVYLMNDAVESFLVFKDARMTGCYKDTYEGPITANLSQDGAGFVLVVRQDDSVVSIFFSQLELEVHLYNYGQTGHFWVEGYEYLRQLEYQIAILNNKLEYLGKDYCTPEEIALAPLAEFPPLNFSCYPAVPEKYLVPNFPYWMVSEEAIHVMMQLAQAVNDQTMLFWLGIYQRFPGKPVAKYLAWMLHRRKHHALIMQLRGMLCRTLACYPDRHFTPKEESRYEKLKEQAEERQKVLAEAGIRSELVREEPFVYAKDSITYKCYLMKWIEKAGDISVSLEKFEE